MVVGWRALVTARKFPDLNARVHREGAWYIAQATTVDIASQGRSEREALANLREALELYFTPDAGEGA